LKLSTLSQEFDNKKLGFWEAIRNLPKGVCAVSLFGFFLGISTTMVYSQLGLFLKNEIGLSTAEITLLDGIVECIAFVVRVFSGPISDFLGERKTILYVGCLFTLVGRSLIATASSWLTVVFIQSAERLGNGIQATPRDALIADLSPQEFRGRSFGFTRSAKTLGSLLGNVIAVLLMYLLYENYRMVFFCSTVPVIIAIFCLSKIKTPNKIKGIGNENRKMENPFKKKYLKSLDSTFWKIIALALIFEMGHFCEHAFSLYANTFASATMSSTVSSFVSLGQVLMSFTIGFLADKYGKRKLIAVCMACMIIANVSFISAKYIGSYPLINIYIGSFLWGGQMTAVQGLFLSLISEVVDYRLRATAMGIYFLMLGVAYFSASTIAGRIWDTFGVSYTFLYSAGFSLIALCLLRVLAPKSVASINNE
jgi:MFS family permease